MAPRNLRKKRVADSDDEEDDQGAQGLRERMEDAKMLIKNRAKSKVRPRRRFNPRNLNQSHARRLTLAPHNASTPGRRSRGVGRWIG